MEELLTTIVQNPLLHARWLNTLSYLENVGARKIARCQHPTQVREEMLKHAAEEFRHALHFKRQIGKVSKPLESYSLPSLLGGKATLHYLHSLDISICRLLKGERNVAEIAYLLVTYAIECRASRLYSLYDQVLRKLGSPVQFKSILLEEVEHLQEIRQAYNALPCQSEYLSQACRLENRIFEKWLLFIIIDCSS